MENIIFKDLNLSKEVIKAIETMGFEEATSIQSQAIPPLMDGKDVIAQAPTGTGKTCAFGIPIIEKISLEDHAIQALILCPTRELVLQTTDELQNVAQFKHGIKILPIYGGQEIERQIIALKKHPQIVVSTPGRMMDHLRRKTAKINGLKTVVLDEADEMLNMGFREDIDIILETVPEDKQMVLFSATLSKEIIEIANKYQRNAISVKVAHKELTIPLVQQFYIEVRANSKSEILTRIIDHNKYKLCLVFCNTKRMVDELTEYLITRGYSAEALHGDMRQTQRDKTMSRFRKGAVEILVATDVAARGIDVEDIEAVFNYDIPNDEEYYVHRIGRTGRANKKGVSYTFAYGREINKLRDIMRYTKATIHPIKAPTEIDVEETKINELLNEIKNITATEKLDKYISYIEKLIDSDETNELTTMDISAAFLKILMEQNKKKVSGLTTNIATDNNDKYHDRINEKSNDRSNTRFSDRNSERSSRRYSNADSTRFFINIGKMDKIDNNSLKDFIELNANVGSENISGIRVCDKFSFFDVTAEKADNIIPSISSVKLKGRKIVVEKSEKK